MKENPNNYVAIHCPQCGAQVAEVHKAVAVYLDPHFSHRCGKRGKLRWVNPKYSASSVKRKKHGTK